MNIKNKQLLKKLNREELKAIGGGFYVCIVNGVGDDAMVLPENNYEARIIDILGSEEGWSAVRIANYLCNKGCVMNILHFDEEADVMFLAETLWRRFD